MHPQRTTNAKESFSNRRHRISWQQRRCPAERARAFRPDTRPQRKKGRELESQGFKFRQADITDAATVMDASIGQDKKGERLSNAVTILQILFYVVVSIGTVFNLYLLHRQSKLVYKPAIGVTDIDKVILRKEGDAHKASKNIDSVKGFVIKYALENVGNLPAKNFKIKHRSQLGDVMLPYAMREDDNAKGSVFIMGVRAWSDLSVRGDDFEKFALGQEALTDTIELSFTDWEEYQTYRYTLRFSIEVKSTDPFDIRVVAVQ